MNANAHALRALVLALLMVVSVVALGFGTLPAAADETPPPGMQGVPDGNVGPPDHAEGDGPPPHAYEHIPTDAAVWDIHASSHAGDLEVEIGATEAGQLAMLLRDENNHEGREVALRADPLIDTLEYQPEAVFGTHDSGDEWTAPIEYDGEYAVFEVPHFSENTIEFTGGISIDADPADDGQSFVYEVDDQESVENFELNLTGHLSESTETDVWKLSDGDLQTVDVGGTTTATTTVEIEGIEERNTETVESGIEDGDQLDVTVGGNKDPEGPANGLPQVTLQPVTGIDGTDDGGTVGDSTGDRHTVYLADAQGKSRFSEFDGVVKYDRTDRQRWADVTLYAIPGDRGNDVFSQGEEVCTASDWRDEDSDLHQSDLSCSTANLQNGNTTDGLTMGIEIDDEQYIESVEVDLYKTEYHDSEFDFTVSSDTDSVSLSSDGSEGIELSTAEDGLDVTGWGLAEATVEWEEITVTEDPTISVGGTTVIDETGYVEDGQTVSDQTQLEPGDHDVTASTANNTEVTTTVERDEQTETQDPTIYVNGQEAASHTGTLSDGQTETFSPDASLVEEGENVIEVEVAPDVDRPTGMVRMEYQHDANTVSETVTFEAEEWTERYDVSRTWPSDEADAEMKLSFKGDVVELRDLEVREGGAEWSTPENYEFDNSTLTVEFGSIEAGTTTDIRINGSKVKVHDGEIEVIQPTIEGNDLETEFEIVEYDSNMSIETSETSSNQWVHYTTDESWSAPDSHARITAGGNQHVHLPEATQGATATMRTAPLEVAPETGEAEIRIIDVDEIRFSVASGSTAGDDLEVTYHDVVSGESYELYAVGADEPLAWDHASTVTFEIGDHEETYTIKQGSQPGSGGTVLGPSDPDESDLSPILLLLAVVAALAGLALITRWVTGADPGRAATERLPLANRLPLPSLPAAGTAEADDPMVSRALLVGGTIIIGLVAIEIVSPGTLPAVLSAFATGTGSLLAEVAVILLGAGLLIGVWLLDQRTAQDIPRWLMGLTAVIAVVMVVETVAPEALLGPVSAGFETVSPLFWLALIAVGAYFVRGWIQSRREPDQEVTIELDGGD